MQDFNNTYVKWIAFFQAPGKLRKQVIDALHPEVQKGFAAIMKIAFEEIKGRVENYRNFENIEEQLKQLLINSVFGGYMLHSIHFSIDPIKLNIKEKKEIEEIGNMWVENQKKDKGASLLKQVDPFMIMIIEKAKQAKMNQILLTHPEISKLPYKDVFEMERFFIWSAIQGYLFGVLERKIIQSNNNEY